MFCSLCCSPDGNNVESYLKLLDRLKVAGDFFNHNNPNSVELSNVVRERKKEREEEEG